RRARRHGCYRLIVASLLGPQGSVSNVEVIARLPHSIISIYRNPLTIIRCNDAHASFAKESVRSTTEERRKLTALLSVTKN
ncbi:hypothetical protein PENTCL1PPCAC_14984, partial [Pristionchus entomophagus]